LVSNKLLKAGIVSFPAIYELADKAVVALAGSTETVDSFFGGGFEADGGSFTGVLSGVAHFCGDYVHKLLPLSSKYPAFQLKR
jgi:hypothetical protein